MTTRKPTKRTAAQQKRIDLRIKMGKRLSSEEFTEKKRTGENMPDFYNCKYFPKDKPKKVKYGVQQRYEHQAEARWIQNRDLIIEDAITAVPNVISLNDYVVIKVPMTFSWNEEGPDEYHQFIEKEWKKACDKSDAVTSGLKDKIFSIGVADGSAWYIVTKETKQNVYLEWRGWDGGDRYVHQMLGYKGAFPKRMIKPYICKVKFSDSCSRGW